MGKFTPMMEQYFVLKEKYKDCILFYRLGDFYEMFFDDAILASKELEIALTGRECGMDERAPMCGIPFHSATLYINKLISKGLKVAICEQLTDPKESKGIVERDVVRVITPGTVIEEDMLKEKDNSYIICVHQRLNNFSLAACDVSTGVFYVEEFSGKNAVSKFLNSVLKFNPHEIVLEKDSCIKKILGEKFNYSFINDATLDINYYKTLLSKQFSFDQTENIKNYNAIVLSAGILIDYLNETQKTSLDHINQIQVLCEEEYMILDDNTMRHLEVTQVLKTGEKKGSLLWLLDKTNTSMGGRLLKSWLEMPLQDLNKIENRQQAVKELMENQIPLANLNQDLNNIYDIERIISKLSYGTLNPKDCIALKESLKVLPSIKKNLGYFDAELIKQINADFDLMEDVYTLLDAAILDDAPISVKDGEIIKKGFNDQIDELIDLTTNAKQYLLNLEEQEKNETGIKNLKIGYNKIFGYYLEVTKSYYDLVPYRYVRKQTLANCERFITEELKEIEDKILSAGDRRVNMEYGVFCDIRQNLASNLVRFQTVASKIATIDVLCSLALVAMSNNYVQPTINCDGKIKIINGRHPIVEKSLESSFVSNDATLDMDENNFAIITGPNMAGKSTYMRQVALITLLAHIGSFVPAKQAEVTITDKIFTRIGASDELASGKSTFMVEMSELATILNDATKDSLIILDEIGRGTSTIDGLSIALATVMYVAEKIKAKSLFATHYHELTSLEEKINGVVNLRVAVKEVGSDVVFLHTIEKGGSDNSFGVYVAKLAGLPQPLLNKASEIILELQNDNNHNLSDVNVDLDFTNEEDVNEKSQEIIDALNTIDVNNITPIQALQILTELKQRI